MHTAHTCTTTSHYLTIDGVEYPTTFPALDYLPTFVKENGDGTTTVVYGTLDEDPIPWSDMHDGSIVTMILTAPSNHVALDTPDDDVDALMEVAEMLADVPPKGRTVTVRTECVVIGRCAGGDAHDKHDTYRVATVDYDGSMYGGDEIVLDGYGDLPSTDGLEDMLIAWKGGETDTLELARAYARRGMPGRTFVDWSVTGYCQGDWSEGYAYSDELDAEGIDAYVDEYAAHFRGDVYTIVREEYRADEDGEMVPLDYDCVGGYIGDWWAAKTIKSGGF